MTGEADRARREAIPTIYRPVLLAAGLLLLGLLFQQLVTLILAVLITVILAIPLSAVATFLQRWRVPRTLGALVGLLIGFLLVGGIFALVIPQLVAQVQSFVDTVPATLDSISRAFGGLTGSEPTAVGDSVQAWFQGYLDDPARLVGPLTTVGYSVAGAVAAAILVLISAFYMAARPAPLVSGLLRVVPPARRERALRVMTALREAWIGWLRGVVVDMLVTGVLLYVGLLVIGLDFALLFAVISALLVVIPYFGSVVGAIPPVLFGLADSPTKALLALGVYVLVQQVESNVIIPVVMARTTKLHPAMVAVGVVIVGQLFGFLGLFVAVPIISTVVVLTREIWVRPMEEADPLAPELERPEGWGPTEAEPGTAGPDAGAGERGREPDAPLPT